MSRSVRLLTLWSGPLPDYLPLFLLTAGRNASVEFVFVADSPAPHGLLDGGLPPNVRWVERSHDRLVSEIGDRIGLALPDVSPYKLCDYKPTFGATLPDLLEGADFWGHVDCDMVLGDLRAFATDDVLDANDLVCFRGRRFVHGPLTLYRNVDAVNRLYTHADDWKRTLTSPAMRSFTESLGWWAWKGQSRPPGTPDSFSDAVHCEARAGRVRLYDEDHVDEGAPGARPLSMRWEDGALHDEVRGRPLAYYHLVGAKSAPLFRVPAWRALPRAFTITGRGIRAEGEGALAFESDRLGRGGVPFLRAQWDRARAGVRRRVRP